MNTRSRVLLGLFLAFLAGSGVGFLVGGYSGTNFGIALILNTSLEKDARDVHAQINTLRLLRNGNRDEAIEALESDLDDQLIIFDPQEPYPGLNPNTSEQIERAIQSAIDYRSAFPRQSARTHVDDMVRNLFERKR